MSERRLLVYMIIVGIAGVLSIAGGLNLALLALSTGKSVLGISAAGAILSGAFSLYVSAGLIWTR